MDIEALVETMAKEIDSGNFNLQVVFDRNIAAIEDFKNQGIMSKRMNELINEKIKGSISDTHFLNLVFRANKKVNKINVNQVSAVEKVTVKASEVETVETIASDDGLKEPLKDWVYKTNIDISLRQATRLEKAGINIEKLCELNFTTPKQVSSYLTKIEHRKSKD